jgi:hypothetical protein
MLKRRSCGSFSATRRRKSLPCAGKAADFLLDLQKNLSQYGDFALCQQVLTQPRIDFRQNGHKICGAPSH